MGIVGFSLIERQHHFLVLVLVQFLASIQLFHLVTGEWFLSITENNEIGGANHGAFIQLLDASATTRYRCETNVALTLDAWNTVGWAWDGVTGAVGHMVGALNGNNVALTESENDFNSIYNRAGYVAIGAGLTGTTYDSYTDGLAQCFSFHSTARSVAWFAHMDAQVRDNSKLLYNLGMERRRRRDNPQRLSIRWNFPFRCIQRELENTGSRLRRYCAPETPIQDPWRFKPQQPTD